MDNEAMLGKLASLNVNAPAFVPNINAAAFVPSYLREQPAAVSPVAQTSVDSPVMDTSGMF